MKEVWEIQTKWMLEIARILSDGINGDLK